MAYSILEKYKDMTGKWRVRVSQNENEAIFLFFESEPSDLEVQAQTDKFVTNRLAQIKKEERIRKIEDVLETIKSQAVEYIENNPLATKAEIIAFIKGIL